MARKLRRRCHGNPRRDGAVQCDAMPTNRYDADVTAMVVAMTIEAARSSQTPLSTSSCDAMQSMGTPAETTTLMTRQSRSERPTSSDVFLAVGLLARPQAAADAAGQPEPDATLFIDDREASRLARSKC
jgi:hypothetical protein